MMGNTKRQLCGVSRLVLPFLCGVVSAYYVPVECGVVWLVLLALVSALLSFVLWRHRVVSGLSLCLAAFFMGSARMSAELHEEAVIPFSEDTGYTAVTLDDAAMKGKTLRVDAVVVEVDGAAIKPFKIKLTVLPTDLMEIKCGMAVHCRGTLLRPENYPGSTFNYERYMQVHGFMAQSFVYGGRVSSASVSRRQLPLWTRLGIGMSAVRGRLASVFRESGMEDDNLAVVYAMALGDKRLLHRDLRDAYSVAGTSHVLALSGLHLGIIYSLLLLLLWRGNRLWWWRFVVQLLVLAAVWTYVMLVGMPVSAVRSALMISVGALVIVSGRVGQSFVSLSVAALVVVIASPMSVFDLGFQMSFIAVASILIAAEPLYLSLVPAWMKRSAAGRWMGRMLSVSVVAQAGVAPLTAYCFGRFSCYFLLANVIVVPLATLLLYLALGVALGSGLPVVGQVLVYCLDSVSQLLNDGVSVLSALPGASVENIRMSALQTVLVYALMVVVYVLVRFVSRRRVRVSAKYSYPDVEEGE